MARYTVHVPARPPVRAEALVRAVFVRDGWSWGAFFYGPFWLFWHRHWLIGFFALVLWGPLLAVLLSQPIAEGAKAMAILVLALLWGFEGASLRRLALQFAGHAEEALVVGDTLDEIERRFFVEAAEEPTAAPAASLPPVSPRNPWGVPVIGLFPDSRKPQ